MNAYAKISQSFYFLLQRFFRVIISRIVRIRNPKKSRQDRNKDWNRLLANYYMLFGCY